jgi:outer membrane receptor protein involved in Fe transport
MNGGKISLSKEISKATNIFMTVAKGYKKGGFNLGLTSEPGIQNDDLIYNPEFLTNYEIGMKSEILKSGINFDGVIFYSDRKNQQVLISSQVDPTDPNTFLFLTQNAAKGINYGFEGNLNFEITEHIEIYGNLGILKTEIRDWVSRPELEGRAQAHAPEKSYSMGLNIDINTNAYLSINISGKSGFYYSDSHNNKSKSYTLSDITYGYINNDWKYKIWVRNLFNKYYSVRGFYFGNEAPDFENTLYERHGDPRHIGLSVEYDF